MADSPANHVWYDAEGKERPAREKKSMAGAEPCLFREEGRPEPPTPEAWAALNARHLALEKIGRDHLIVQYLGMNMSLAEAIDLAESEPVVGVVTKAKAPKADAPKAEEV